MAPRSKAQNEAQKEQTRQKLILTALQAFAEKGYASASMSYIAKEAGVSKGLSYHYFASKEELLDAIFNFLGEVGHSIEDQWEGKSPKERLRLTVEMTFAYIQQNPDLVRFMTSLVTQPDVVTLAADFIAQEKMRSIDNYIALFRALGYADPETEAYFFGAAIDGVSLGHLGLSAAYPLEKLKQRILDQYQL